MKFEDHMDIINRFLLVLPVYFIGHIIIYFGIFDGLASLNYFIWKNLNWNIFFGTEISMDTKHAIENFIWALTKFMMVAANIFLLWIAARILEIFRYGKKAQAISSKDKNRKRYSIIYGFIGLIFGLMTTGIISTCYFFIITFTALKYYPVGEPGWTDLITFIIMPILFSLGTVFFFIISGIKGGKRLC